MTTGAPDGDEARSSAPADPPLVSVVIPVYNSSATIERALNSVLGQTDARCELIVVDDASRDQTVELVRRFTSKCELRLIVQPKNGGPAAARNAGLAAARGEYIAFLDADDEWLPQKTSLQIRALEENPSASFCSCDETWLYTDGSIEAATEPRELRDTPMQAWKLLLAQSFVHTSSVVFRRQYAEKLGGFDADLLVGEDQDLWIRLAREGELAWIAEPLVRVHKLREGHMTINASRVLDHLLPMIERHVAAYGGELSPQERRAILGRRYTQIGRYFCVHGAWLTGASLIVKALTMRYRPASQLFFLIRSTPPARWLKGRISAIGQGQV